MGVIITDGFDVYSAIGNMAARGYTSQPTAIETSIVRTGSTGRSIRIVGASIARFPLPSNMEYVYIGFAWRKASDAQAANQVVSFWDSATQQCTLGFNASTGRFYVARGNSGGTILNTGANTFAQDAWHYIEVKAQINSSTAASGFLVYINGVLEITVTTASDTNSSANNYANSIGLGGNSSVSMYYDDLYVSDSAVLLTNPRIVTLYPNGNGNENDFVGSDSNSTDNYLLVDSTLYQTTDYVQSSVVDDNDLYAMGNLPYTPDQIHSVTVCGLYARDSSGARQARTLLRSGGTNFEGSAIALSETATYYSTVYLEDPATTDPWDLAGVNGMETGITVEA